MSLETLAVIKQELDQRKQKFDVSFIETAPCATALHEVSEAIGSALALEKAIARDMEHRVSQVRLLQVAVECYARAAAVPGVSADVVRAAEHGLMQALTLVRLELKALAEGRKVGLPEIASALAQPPIPSK